MTTFVSPGNSAKIVVGGSEFATSPDIVEMGTILISVDEAVGTSPGIAHIEVLTDFTASGTSVTIEF